MVVVSGAAAAAVAVAGVVVWSKVPNWTFAAVFCCVTAAQFFFGAMPASALPKLSSLAFFACWCVDGCDGGCDGVVLVLVVVVVVLVVEEEEEG